MLRLFRTRGLFDDADASGMQDVHLESHDHAYGPVGGTEELRQTVADHYSRLFLSGRRSLYTKDNVTIASGGRLALSRLLATLGPVKVSY